MPFGIYFNRVEGYTPLLREEVIFKHANDLSVKGNLPYSTHRNRFSYYLEVKYPVIRDKLKISGSIFDNVVSNEYWTVSVYENTLAGIFYNIDYMNYYSLKGYGFSTQYFFNKTVSIRVNYMKLNYKDLGDSIGFARSLFKSDNEYRINPSVPEEEQDAIIFNLKIDKLRSGLFFGESGWQTGITYKMEYGDIRNHLLNISSSMYLLSWGLQKIYFSGNLIMNKGSYRQVGKGIQQKNKNNSP